MSLVIALKYRPFGIVSSAEIFLRVYGTMNMTYTRLGTLLTNNGS